MSNYVFTGRSYYFFWFYFTRFGAQEAVYPRD